ncbi:MAG: AAA family ATPase, partial [Trebonia sp.]
MSAAYIHRDAERRLQELASWLRVVIVNGPRQSGKTTLLRLFQERRGTAYVTLDDPAQLALARSDPVTFVSQGPPPLIIDEVQRGGDELIRSVKVVVDQSQDRG